MFKTITNGEGLIVGRDIVSFVGESIDVPVLVDGQVVVKWLLGLRRY